MNIEDIVLIKSIGKGAFGEVFLTSKKGTKKQFATKKVQKSVALDEKVKKYFNNEIFILRNVNHPNIIKLHEIKQTLNNFYLVFDLCNGGGLSNCLEKYMKNNGNKPFTQEIVQHIMRQLVSGLQYLHNNKILHRDLKSDNVLVNFEKEEDKKNFDLLKCVVKIIDFGFARYLENDTLAQSVLGSPINMDPQILMKMRKIDNNQSFGYDQKADIWSLGTICYEILIGSPPFDATSYEELTSKIQRGNYKIPNNLQLSVEAVSFLNAMLQYDPKQRLDINQLAKHKFLTLNSKEFTPLSLKKVQQRFSNNDLTMNTKNITQSVLSIFEINEGSIDDIEPGMIDPKAPNYSGENKGIVDKIDDPLGNMNKQFGNMVINNTENGKKNDNVMKNNNKNNETDNFNVKDIKDLLYDSFDKMNKDFYYIEPMLIPIVPNTDPKVLQLDI
jgi:serine/threonine protein kinase